MVPVPLLWRKALLLLARVFKYCYKFRTITVLFNWGGMLYHPFFILGSMELQKNRSELELKFLDLCHKILSENGLELYDLEYIPSTQLLRVFIYNKDTKTADLEDCVKIDHAFSPYCEEEDWIPESLTLEVSSPGMFRELSLEPHFKMSEGEMVSFTLKANLDDETIKLKPSYFKNKKLRAMFVKLEGDKASFIHDEIPFNVELNKIKKIQLDPDF